MTFEEAKAHMMGGGLVKLPDLTAVLSMKNGDYYEIAEDGKSYPIPEICDNLISRNDWMVVV